MTFAEIVSAAVAEARRRIPAMEGSVFDEAKARACIEFFPRFLRLTDDEWAGKPFYPGYWQAVIIARFFGWKRPNGTRVYRRLGLWVPRKNGKTELMAGLGLLALLVDGVRGGQGYAIGANRDQADIVYRKMTAMIGMSQELHNRFAVYKTGFVYTPLESAFKPLTGKPEGKHGYSMSVLCGDELHEWPDDRLYQFIHQSSAARRQPIEFLISTAGVRRGFGWEFFNHCEAVENGMREDPELLVVIYGAGAEDDWTDPAVWQKANPNYGVSVRPEYLAAECLKARESARLENDFKRYHLNMWTEQAVRWLPLATWDENSQIERPAILTDWKAYGQILAREEKRLEGRSCYGALDLGLIGDIAAFVMAFPEPDGRVTLLPRFWAPQDGAERRQKTDKVPYLDWAKAGLLRLTPGKTTNLETVQGEVLDDCQRFGVQKVGYDSWNSEGFKRACEDAGVPIQSLRQGWKTMSPFSKDFERAFIEMRIEHIRHPILRWMVGNAAIWTDAAGNIKPDKQRSTDRIDGLVAAIMAFGLAGAEPETPVSPWENPDFRLQAS